MGKSQTILNDLKQAMLDKKPDRVSVLRMLVASLKNARIEKGEELNDQEVEVILKKEAKKRRESIEIYQKANRDELVKKEQDELVVIEEYLPKQMSKEEVVKIVKQLQAEGKIKSDFGEAMKIVMAEVKGQADGKMVAEAVKEAL